MDRKLFRSRLDFEVLAKLFFDITEERYPSAEKNKQLTAQVIKNVTTDEHENIHTQIAVLNAIRDMIKEVSPTQLYRSLQHRDDVYLSVIEALEDLEDELEELEDKMAEDEEEDEDE